MLCEGTCPNCSKRLRISVPYNTDLFQNTLTVVCSGCNTHMKATVLLGGIKLQMIFKPGEDFCTVCKHKVHDMEKHLQSKDHLLQVNRQGKISPREGSHKFKRRV